MGSYPEWMVRGAEAASTHLRLVDQLLGSDHTEDIGILAKMIEASGSNVIQADFRSRTYAGQGEQ